MLMLMLFMLLGKAAAGDDEVVGPVKAGQTITAPTKSWLLPDDHYNACLTHALNAQSLGKQLALCVETGQQALTANAQALGLCRGTLGDALVQLNKDSTLTADLTDRIMLADAQAARYKRQRNTALGVLGGVALTTTVVAVARRTR